MLPNFKMDMLASLVWWHCYFHTDWFKTNYFSIMNTMCHSNFPFNYKWNLKTKRAWTHFEHVLTKRWYYHLKIPTHCGESNFCSVFMHPVYTIRHTSFKQSSTLQQGWSSVNGNMTAYRLQSGTSCTGYQSVNGSSSRRVFSCTTACTVHHSAICPACVSRSLSTPAADTVDTYNQLHAVTSSSQPQKQSATPS